MTFRRLLLAAPLLALLPLASPASAVTPDGPAGSIEVMVENNRLQGTIGTQAIQIDSFRILDGRIDGTYCYARYCQNQGVPRLRLSGRVDGYGQARIAETAGGVASGRWTLQRDARGWSGQWHAPDGRRRLPVALRSSRPQPPWQLSVFLDGPLPAADDDCLDAPTVVAVGLHRDGRRAQVLPTDSQGGCSPFLPEVVDLDFDGHADLMLALFLPAGPNIPYQYWRQDPRTGLLEDISAQLAEVTSPEFDPVHRLVHSFWRSSAASHGVTVWRWVDGRLQEVDHRASWFLNVSRGGQFYSCYVLPRYQDGHIVETPQVIDEGTGRLRLEPASDCEEGLSPSSEPPSIWQRAADGTLHAVAIAPRWRDRGPGHAQRWCTEQPILDLERQRIDWLWDEEQVNCTDTAPSGNAGG